MQSIINDMISSNWIVVQPDLQALTGNLADAFDDMGMVWTPRQPVALRWQHLMPALPRPRLKPDTNKLKARKNQMGTTGAQSF